VPKLEGKWPASNEVHGFSFDRRYHKQLSSKGIGAAALASRGCLACSAMHKGTAALCAPTGCCPACDLRGAALGGSALVLEGSWPKSKHPFGFSFDRAYHAGLAKKGFHAPTAHVTAKAPIVAVHAKGIERTAVRNALARPTKAKTSREAAAPSGAKWQQTKAAARAATASKAFSFKSGPAPGDGYFAGAFAASGGTADASFFGGVVGLFGGLGSDGGANSNANAVATITPDAGTGKDAFGRTNIDAGNYNQADVGSDSGADSNVTKIVGFASAPPDANTSHFPNIGSILETPRTMDQMGR